MTTEGCQNQVLLSDLVHDHSHPPPTLFPYICWSMATWKCHHMLPKQQRQQPVISQDWSTDMPGIPPRAHPNFLSSWRPSKLYHVPFLGVTMHLSNSPFPSVKRSVPRSVRSHVRPSRFIFKWRIWLISWVKVIKWHHKQWYDDYDEWR